MIHRNWSKLASRTVAGRAATVHYPARWNGAHRYTRSTTYALSKLTNEYTWPGPGREAQGGTRRSDRPLLASRAADIRTSESLQYRQNVILVHDQQCLVIDDDFGASPIHKQDAVPVFHLVRSPRAVRQ